MRPANVKYSSLHGMEKYEERPEPQLEKTEPKPEFDFMNDFKIPKDFVYKKVGDPDVIHELDPLTSKYLEDELQNIMIQVWQSLPEKASSEAEHVVAERFRNEAGDDLRNMLGLNATKRLLNVFNPLMIKLEFDRKPVGMPFQQLVRWLGCLSLRRVTDGAHNYVAQLRRVQDFDRACNKRVFKKQEFKVKMTPCYNFTVCPPNVRTVYKEPEKPIKVNKTTRNKTPAKETAQTKKDESKTEKNDSSKKNTETKNENTATKPDVTKKVDVASVTVATKPIAKKESVSAAKISEPKNSNVNTATKSTSTADQAKAVAANKSTNTTPAKVVPGNKVSNTTQTKVLATSKTTNTTATEVAPTNKITNTTQTKVSAANKVTNTTQSKAVVANKVATVNQTKDVPVKAANTTPAKVEATKATVVKTTPIKTNTSTNAPKAKVETAQKLVTKVAKAINTKPIAKTPVKPAPKVVQKQRKQSDFDELDDEDILALMSNAIVLDECCGSEDES